MRNRTHNKVWRRYEGKLRRVSIDTSPYYVSRNDLGYWCLFRDMPTGNKDVLYVSRLHDYDGFIDANIERDELLARLNRTQ